MAALEKMNCIPCRGGDPAVTGEQLETFLAQLTGWEVDESNEVPHLVKTYQFNEYLDGANFAARLAAAADAQDHHPSILIGWHQVTVRWWTHIIGGLHINDFVSAFQSDLIFTQELD
ncbi:MAG: 4a-hydroxytetrahydrobiopterin dehydratase [Anaerolineae bacterium]|nr:4a-hydroxytetrahydrobiopterin dehydratase [Anaerolineae bacterium]